MAFRHQEPPALKKSVDIQLQSAFADENWSTVLRLADRRLKATGDAYYEVLKVCVESQLDTMAERAAAAVAVDAMIRNNTTPADLDAIVLLEWACAASHLLPPPPGAQPAAADATAGYAHTFGTLRLRWAKANPRKVQECTACLRECLHHWDLVNAQQIAAVLDKSSNASDRRFLYWNILLTHMLSTSPQCPPAKRKIYGMLAQKQLEKAAEPAEAQGLGPAAPALPDRALRDEEDFLLYFRVLAAHGAPANYRQRALHARVGAVPQFVGLGRKQLFLEVLAQLEAAGDWDAVFGLCQRALSETPAGVAGPPTQACDLRIWKSFLAAAQRRVDVTSAFDQVQDLLNRFVTADPKLPPMYAKNTGLALLLTVFSLPPSLLPPAPAEGPADGDAAAPLSPRVEQLLLYIDAHLDKSAVFADIKTFVEQLPFAEAAALLDRLAADNAADEKEKDDHPDNARSPGRTIQRTVLLYKLRYLVLSSPATAVWPKFAPGPDAADAKRAAGQLFVPACKWCGQAVDAGRAGGSCAACLTALATESLRLHRRLSADADGFARTVLPRLDKDPRIDLTLVAVSCLLRLGGVAQPRRRFGVRRWYGPSTNGAAHVLRAAALLDAQQRQTPDDAGLRLLLVRLLVRLGSCAAATVEARLWQPLAVKNAILDALGPLFYDRLATVAPGLFQGGTPLLQPLHAYYRTVLRRPAPVKVWDAFAAGSYSSILDMAAYQGQLQRSCTRAMAVVEERRAARLFGAKLEDVAEVAIFADITHETPLVNATDAGPLPNLEHAAHPALADLLQLGPGLSNTRMHLGLLAEQFLDVVRFVPAKDYKPARPGDAAAADRAFLAETLDVLQSALQDTLHAPGARAQLTAAEYAHATVVAALATLAALSLAPVPASAPAADPFGLLAQTVTTMLDLLRGLAMRDDKGSPSLTDDKGSGTPLDALLCDTGNLHALALLRDAAAATKQTAAFLAALHERETARDRSGGTAGPGLPKAALAQTRSLPTAAGQALAAAKAHVGALQAALGASGWLDRLADAVGGTESKDEGETALARAVVDVVGGPAAVEDWAGQVLDGWRDTAKGWGGVQLEA